MKRNRPFILGALIFAANLILDGWIYAEGSSILGILLCLGTILVFGSGFIWLIYHEDRSLHFKKGWLLIPLIGFGLGIDRALEKSSATFLPTPENLQEVAVLIMTRFQIGLWLVSLILLFAFVMAGSLMLRRRT